MQTAYESVDIRKDLHVCDWFDELDACYNWMAR